MIFNNLIRWATFVFLLLWSVVLILRGECWWGITLHAAVVGPVLWGTLNPNSKIFGPIQKKTGTDELWLTLDDGPDSADTPILLELLARYHVKAVFFVIGEKAEKYPELIRQIHAEGHTIGNHTWSHPQSTFWCRGPWATYREILRCQKVIESITGESPTLFRAPVGHSNMYVHQTLKKLNLQLVGWTSRGFDAVAKDAGIVVERIVGSMEPGSIVLAHESTPMAAEVLERIIQHVHTQGWRFSDPNTENHDTIK